MEHWNGFSVLSSRCSLSSQCSRATSHYSKENPHPDYAAQDTTFSELWPGQLTELHMKENKILYWKYDDSGEIVHTEFDYTGF